MLWVLLRAFWSSPIGVAGATMDTAAAAAALEPPMVPLLDLLARFAAARLAGRTGQALRTALASHLGISTPAFNALRAPHTSVRGLVDAAACAFEGDVVDKWGGAVLARLAGEAGPRRVDHLTVHSVATTLPQEQRSAAEEWLKATVTDFHERLLAMSSTQNPKTDPAALAVHTLRSAYAAVVRRVVTLLMVEEGILYFYKANDEQQRVKPALRKRPCVGTDWPPETVWGMSRSAREVSGVVTELLGHVPWATLGSDPSAKLQAVPARGENAHELVITFDVKMPAPLQV